MSFDTKLVRDKYTDQVDILDSIKHLEMLPDNKYTTITFVAIYYEVKFKAIDNLIHAIKDELVTDGLLVLEGEDLNTYKDLILKGHGLPFNENKTITLIPKEAVLRMGLFLTTPIAMKLKDKLNHKEDIGMKYHGEWTDELDGYMLGRMREMLLDSVTVPNALIETAKEMRTTTNIIRKRWYVGGTYRKPLRMLISEDDQREIKSLNLAKRLNARTFNKKDATIVEDVNEVNNLVPDVDIEYVIRKSMEGYMESIENMFATTQNIFNELKADQTQITLENKEIKLNLAKITKSLDEHSLIMNNTYGDKINSLEDEVELLNRKIKKNKVKLRKADMYIRKYITTNIELEEPKNQQPQTRMKMERNGNLVKIN